MQGGLDYRDVPSTTYNRLVAAGAGIKTKKASSPGKAKAGGNGKEKAKATKASPTGGGRLEPLDACEALLYQLPQGLRETLLPFQRDGVLYGLRRRGRCLIADEMGTGKVKYATVPCVALTRRGGITEQCGRSV